jgi:archaeosortase A (PGF-CTERM-specific)
MPDYLVLFSFIAFLLFLVPWRYRHYAAIAGWTGVVLTLFSDVPHYISINNFLYPGLAILSVPFLVITSKYLLRSDWRALALSNAAAAAFVIYAPFQYITPLGDWLISVVAGQTLEIVQFFVSGATIAGNTIALGRFSVEIILACTGIQGIAIMLGVAAAVKTNLRQKLYAFLLVVPMIYILNLLRNAAVIIAYTGQWFPFFPEIAGNGEYGYESFFWAHNVIAELLALLLLVGIAFGLFRIIPRLSELATGLYDMYRDEVMRWSGRGKGAAAPPRD